MMRAVYRDGIKNIPYGELTHDAASIVKCAYSNYTRVCDGASVSLATLDSNSLKIIRNGIGKVIKSNKYSTKIQFNIDFGHDDNLYVLTSNSILKNTMGVVVAYKTKNY